MHLLCHPLPHGDSEAALTAAVVIGVGNSYRRDDGVGPAVAAAVEALGLPGVRVCRGTETTAVLDAWEGAGLAVVVDAAVGGSPGRVRRCELADLTRETVVSSHELSLRQAYELALALDRAPASVLVVTVDVADTGHGVGLSPGVAAALPEAVRVVRRAIGEQAQKTRHEQP